MTDRNEVADAIADALEPFDLQHYTDGVQRAREALDGITPESWVNYTDFHGTVHTLDGLTETDVRFALAAPDLVRELAAAAQRNLVVAEQLIAVRDEAQAWAAWFAAEAGYWRSEDFDLRHALEELLHVQYGESQEWETVDALVSGELSREDLHKRLWAAADNDRARADKAESERDELRAAVERVRGDLEGAAYRAGLQQGKLARAEAAIERARVLAERWDADPCVCGYRIPDGNDTDSQCLHCGATSLRRALDGEDDRG